MRVLVIGATGFLGSHILRNFSAAGIPVTGLGRSADKEDVIRSLCCDSLRGDLNDPSSLLPLLPAYDAIVYAAQLDLKAEYEIVSALIRVFNGSNKTLIFTSGTGLLSQRTDGAWSEDSFAEDDAFVPSRYIGFRLVTETIVRDAGFRGELRAMVIRPPMIWGNGGCGHLRMFYEDAGRSGSVGYLGAGLNLYSNVHVEDLAEVYRLALDRGQAGALYHAVAGEMNNRSLASAVAADLKVPVVSVTFNEAVARWGKFEALIAMATCSRSRSPRTRNELGWTPRHLDILEDIGHASYRNMATPKRR